MVVNNSLFMRCWGSHGKEAGVEEEGGGQVGQRRETGVGLGVHDHK